MATHINLTSVSPACSLIVSLCLLLLQWLAFCAQWSNPAMSIIGAEDEEFENDLDPTVDDNSSHFASIDLVKGRPTHLLVFLNHVILQFDCSPLILRVQVPQIVSYELDRSRPDLLTEEQQRKFVHEIQKAQFPEVLRQLEDFSLPIAFILHSFNCLLPLFLHRSSCSPLRSSLSVDGGMLVPEASLLGPFPSGPTIQQEEQDPRFLELEQEPPNWREHAPPETLKDLSKKETKRQEVINELFATEHAHVRMLSVLLTVFWKPLEKAELMDTTELSTIFPSLDEIIELHYAFYENLKKLRQDTFIVKTIGTTLLNRFEGTEGEWFQKLTSRFCSHQTWALELLKSRQKKDPRFHAFIQEAESRPQCRRLQLKDIIPTEMQRLTKYPLLLENIAKCTEDSWEKEKIQRSAECCRKILNHVNEEVKQMENLLTLKDYQRKLDTSGLKPSNELYLEYKNFDLTQQKMIYEGTLTWRVTKEKTLDVQCVLLRDLLVLLQKQDDKMVLKCQSKSNIAAQEGKQMLSPIIKLDSAFLREVATDRKAFYVIFTWDSGAQIYELVAQSVGERKTSGLLELCHKLNVSFILLSLLVCLSCRFQPPLSPTENGGDSLKHGTGENQQQSNLYMACH
uniref:DH domain-containing protein n=1 Tax=Esox lucius TaxID=8010 RepID=A0A3P8YTZ9_ESOLU